MLIRKLLSVITRRLKADVMISRLPMKKTYFVYIMTNKNNSVLYTGMTNDLERRILEHKNGLGEGFSSKYKTTKLVYYDTTNQVEEAIIREKKIKKGSRKKKIALIEASNPKWKDLSQ